MFGNNTQGSHWKFKLASATSLVREILRDPCFCVYILSLIERGFHRDDSSERKIGTLGVPTMVSPGREKFVLEIGTFPLKAGRVATLGTCVADCLFELHCTRPILDLFNIQKLIYYIVLDNFKSLNQGYTIISAIMEW